MSFMRLKVVGLLTGHPATKPKLLEEWTCSMIAYLYFLSLQCRSGKHGILLVQL